MQTMLFEGGMDFQAFLDDDETIDYDAYGVEMLEDVRYGRGGGRDLLLDVIRMKAEPLSPRPALVWVHGGGWRMADKKYRPEKALVEYAARGYFCVSIDYRLSDTAVFPAQIEDCKCAVRFLRANGEKYAVDGGRIGIWGESAGGAPFRCPPRTRRSL
jgi:acetyl esterase/lipase